jgi:hypothetical protein
MPFMNVLQCRVSRTSPSRDTAHPIAGPSIDRLLR